MESIGILPPFWIGLWVGLGLLALVGLFWAYEWVAYRKWEWYDGPSIGTVIATVSGGLLAIIALLVQFVGVMIPYDSKYWETYTITSVIESVDTALMSDGDSVSQNFVVELADFDRPVVTTDPRVLNLEGSEVTLLCGVEWVNWGYYTDKWVCSLSDYKFTP